MANIQLKEIQQKLYEKLKPSGWGDKLKLFLLSDDFYKILETLYIESTSGKKFTPVLKQLFTAFEECPYSELKVIILSPEPYPKAELADGMAFSSSNIDTIPASLEMILNDIERTVYPEGYKSKTSDLRHWANQGVLLLNTNLTTTIGSSGVHNELWRPFNEYLFDMLSAYNSGLIYVFMGTGVKKWSKSINANNYKFFTKHPASAAYSKTIWNSGNTFNQINKILKKNNNTTIIW